MKILISREQLELLLEKKRDFIGKKITIDTIIAGISFLISVWTATYETIWIIPGIIFKTIFCVIGIVYMINVMVKSKLLSNLAVASKLPSCLP